MILFEVKSYEARRFANKLLTMKRSAFPTAIRETLSKSALHVKQKTMPIEAQEAFVNRSKNFFKYNSRVEFAKGYDIKTMQSTVGFVDDKLKGRNNYSVKDLEKQEQGGTITNKSLMPLDTARTGKSRNKLVMQKNRLDKIRNVVKVKNGNGNMGWMKAAYLAGVDFTGAIVTGAGRSPADFEAAHLLQTIFNGVNLDGVNMNAAFLDHAQLITASMIEAQLNNAQMAFTNFSGSNLYKAQFKKAMLTSTNFSNANLAGADFSYALIQDANFSGADLSGATWTDGRICATPSRGSCQQIPPP